ncbi:MAG: hypothetical protein QOH81_1133 [Sphingomonadales bacterium]|nr:hypothetical protein [Sphingomonadales bacterium]
MKAIALVGSLAMLALLASCGDERFALRDGCYYVEDGKPILRVQGEDGIILTPPPRPNPAGYTYTPVRRVHLNPRRGRDGPYVDVTPGFYLTNAIEVATSSPSSRFRINGPTMQPVIMVGMEGAGERAVRLGPRC